MPNNQVFRIWVLLLILEILRDFAIVEYHGFGVFRVMQDFELSPW